METALATSAEKIRSDYLLLLSTQLAHQNPLDPMDNSEMASQLAQLGQLEQMQNMTLTFQQMLLASERSQAATLIGKNVSFYLDGMNDQGFGQVAGVEMINGEAHLRVLSPFDVQYTINGVPATEETRLDSLDQAEALHTDDTVTVYGTRPDGTQLGDGEGVTINLHGLFDFQQRFMTLGELAEEIAAAFNVDGAETCVGSLVNGEIRLTDKQTGQRKLYVSLDYNPLNTEGTFELPTTFEVRPALADVVSITDPSQVQ